MAELTKPILDDEERGTVQPKRPPSPLVELLEASKDAERLISCFFDLHAIEGEPFQGIWDRLAKAIHRAHSALRSDGLPLGKAEDGRSFLWRPM